MNSSPDGMKPESSEILLEMIEIGGSMQVRAVDGGDGLEVSFISRPGTSRAAIVDLARTKLGYVRRRRNQTRISQASSASGPDKGLLA